MTTMEKTMLAFSTDWYGAKSFRLMPVSNDCPFNEAIFDPTSKVLAIISRDKKEKPQMLPKLNDKGQLIPVRSTDANQPKFIEERRMMETYYEYYMDAEADVRSFIDRFVVNPEHELITATLSAAYTTEVTE